MLHSLDHAYIYKENGQRLVALAGIGVTVDGINETYYISCEKAPKMFLGLQVLCSAPESKYNYMNYLRLDYKSCFSGRTKGKNEHPPTDQGIDWNRYFHMPCLWFGS